MRQVNILIFLISVILSVSCRNEKNTQRQREIPKKYISPFGDVPFFSFLNLDFPGMEVKVDDKKIKHWHDECRDQPFCYGLITFKIPEGTHKIEVKLNDTWPRSLGNTISLISVLGLGYIFLTRKKYEDSKK